MRKGLIVIAVFLSFRLSVKLIPQKKKLPMKFFETFPECSPPSIVSKKTIKMIGHHSRLQSRASNRGHPTMFLTYF